MLNWQDCRIEVARNNDDFLSLFLQKAQMSPHRNTTHRMEGSACRQLRRNRSRPKLRYTRCVNESKGKHREFWGVDITERELRSMSVRRLPAPRLLPGVRHVAVSLGLCRSCFVSRSVTLGFPTIVDCTVSLARRAHFPLRNNTQFRRSFDATTEHRTFSTVFHKFTLHNVIRTSFSIYNGEQFDACAAVSIYRCARH